MIKRVAQSILFVGLFGLGPVKAAELAVKSVPPFCTSPNETCYTYTFYDWTGFYLGVNGGGVWGRSTQQIFPLGQTIGFGVYGAQVGGTAGFNLQVDQVVYGLEGDLDWANVSGNALCPFPNASCETKSDYLGTVRGRVGYSWDRYRLLTYFTGGAAFGDVVQTFSPALNGNNGIGSNRVGWTVGAGIQYGLSTSWSVKLEYLYVDLGTFSCVSVCSAPSGRENTTLTENVVRMGINYRFGDRNLPLP